MNVWDSTKEALRIFRLSCRECQHGEHYRCKDQRRCPCAKRDH